ncbi:UNVERIFIED_CONTAM: hypothetical protein Slati_1373600 [Sesamum latifolium]|uniref:Uncharacterized protein n=1 Tax=Sesamum latifolium TaxID=2727402 RepID=A0AAW2XIH9_9LAMI
MLVKQGWRNIKQSDILMSRIFLARYFPSGDFWSARWVSNMSFRWRSILEAWEVIKGGVRWKIGDEQRVRVCHDPWIPYVHAHYTSSSFLTEYPSLRSYEPFTVLLEF